MEQVLHDFGKVCNTLETMEKWYYTVKTTEMESNSLAVACGLKTIEELNTVFECAGVLRIQGGGKVVLNMIMKSCKKISTIHHSTNPNPSA